jgi:hypothetical protein
VVYEHATFRVAALLSCSYLTEGLASKGRLLNVASCGKLFMSNYLWEHLNTVMR